MWIESTGSGLQMDYKWIRITEKQTRSGLKVLEVDQVWIVKTGSGPEVD